MKSPNGSPNRRRSMNDEIQYDDILLNLNNSNSNNRRNTLDDIESKRLSLLLLNRIEELESKMTNLNEKISSCCHTFEEVKEYVDKNIADGNKLSILILIDWNHSLLFYLFLYSQRIYWKCCKETSIAEKIRSKHLITYLF